MKVYNELLDHTFDLVSPPRRVVSLLSSATETIERIGRPDAIVGVSEYCGRYTREVAAPVVGQYITADVAKIGDLNPDLVLLTTGVQRKLGLRLARMGLPVYALPLPSSFHGMLENLLTVAALMDEVMAGRRLCEEMSERMDAVRRRAQGAVYPTVYVEIWFGKHLRTIGGRSFIHDLVEMAGGTPLFGDSPAGYLSPDFDAVSALNPERVLFFQEPEYPVDFQAQCEERGWGRMAEVPVIESTVQRGQNVVHDGPSFVETAEWLQAELETAHA